MQLQNFNFFAVLVSDGEFFALILIRFDESSEMKLKSRAMED